MKSKVIDEACLRALKTLQVAAMRENPLGDSEITDHNEKIIDCLSIIGLALSLDEDPDKPVLN